MSSSAPLLLYDAGCPLCCTLAAFVARRSAGAILTQAWQDFQADSAAVAALPAAVRAAPADRLRLLAGSELFEGAAAWGYLMAHYRDLASLNWLAERTGLARPLALGAARAGHIVRRLCRRCPPAKSHA